MASGCSFLNSGWLNVLNVSMVVHHICESLCCIDMCSIPIYCCYSGELLCCVVFTEWKDIKYEVEVVSIVWCQGALVITWANAKMLHFMWPFLHVASCVFLVGDQDVIWGKNILSHFSKVLLPRVTGYISKKFYLKGKILCICTISDDVNKYLVEVIDSSVRAVLPENVDMAAEKFFLPPAASFDMTELQAVSAGICSLHLCCSKTQLPCSFHLYCWLHFQQLIWHLKIRALWGY